MQQTTTRHRFDQQLADLRQKLLRMGFETEEMIRDAVSALEAGDTHQADMILRRDDALDLAEAEIEQQCLLIFATQQPVVALDLRIVATVFKAAADVERIGDHAVNIARITQRMRREGVLYQPLVALPLLSQKVRAMLHEALEAIVHEDEARARGVIEADAEVDALYRRMRARMEALMQESPSVIPLATSLMFVAHYLERVSDHCVSISERLVFQVTGEMIGTPEEDAPAPATQQDAPV
jgi:phosphate transport system regulatory protein PhoU